MAIRAAIIASVLAGSAGPGLAAITIIGSSPARLCYEAADSSAMPTAESLSACEHALSSGSLSFGDRVATHVNRGILRLRGRDVAAAIADFDAATALDPAAAEPYLNKGAALVRLNDAAGAARLFSLALERGPERPAIAHFGRAVALEALGNLRDAYRDYSRASELEPGWTDPQRELRRFQVVPN